MMFVFRSRGGSLLTASALLLAVSLMLLTAPSKASAEVVEEHEGVVLDVRGRPIRDVVVTAYRWNGYMGLWETASADVTGKNGEFMVFVRTWHYGCTYYYITFEASRYVDVRVPALDPNSGFYDCVLTESRCDVCVPEPMTIVMTQERQLFSEVSSVNGSAQAVASRAKSAHPVVR